MEAATQDSLAGRSTTAEGKGEHVDAFSTYDVHDTGLSLQQLRVDYGGRRATTGPPAAGRGPRCARYLTGAAATAETSIR